MFNYIDNHDIVWNVTLINHFGQKIIYLKQLFKHKFIFKLFYHEKIISEVQSENSPGAIHRNIAS